MKTATSMLATTKKIRIIGIRYARMKRAFFASKCLEKKLKNDALNSIKGLSTTHCKGSQSSPGSFYEDDGGILS